jgi:hypothetical protein
LNNSVILRMLLQCVWQTAYNVLFHVQQITVRIYFHSYNRINVSGGPLVRPIYAIRQPEVYLSTFIPLRRLTHATVMVERPQSTCTYIRTFCAAHRNGLGHALPVNCDGTKKVKAILEYFRSVIGDTAKAWPYCSSRSHNDMLREWFSSSQFVPSKLGVKTVATLQGFKMDEQHWCLVLQKLPQYLPSTFQQSLLEGAPISVRLWMRRASLRVCMNNLLRLLFKPFDPLINTSLQPFCPFLATSCRGNVCPFYSVKHQKL